MSAPHTPGPWISLTDHDGRVSITPTGSGIGGSPIAYVAIRGKLNQDRLAANSRLIAAAPELLAALRYCVCAIKRATDLDCITDADAVQNLCDSFAQARAAIAKVQS